jgi:hypothetical protein
MLKLGGLIALIALAAAAFWLTTSYDREPSVPSRQHSLRLSGKA